jgi:predicted transcriptional regulator
MVDLDLDSVLERMESGESQREIAASLGISESTLRGHLNANEEIAARSARARQESAEAWLDRGMKYLEDAPGSSEEIQRARALAQECARRAAIRNPRSRR